MNLVFITVMRITTASRPAGAIRSIHLSAALILPLVLTFTSGVVAEDRTSTESQPALFANRVGVEFGTPEIEAAIVKHLGYAGVSQDWVTGEKLAKRVAAFEKAGLKILSVYLFAKDTPLREEQLEPLRDRGAHIEMPVKEITSKTIQSVRRTAEVAGKLRIRVAIYPHSNYAVETMQQAIDFATKVDHPNVGVMFPLCQFLREKDVNQLETILKKAKPQLFAVNISGGDIGSDDVKRAIQRLDKGTFPQERLLKALKSIEYTGPVELQAWGIPGDRFSNLKTSMAEWRKLTAKQK